MNTHPTDRDWLRRLKGDKSVNLPHQPKDTTESDKPTGSPAPLQPTAAKADKPTKPKNGFKDVAGMEGLKQRVHDEFIAVLQNRECAEAFGIRPPSLLFYGPAGCGKTFFAEKLAEEVGIHFMKVVPDDLASIYVHGTQEKIGQIFRKAEKMAPTLIFFDEFEAMVPRRSPDDHSNQNGETNEFLCMLNNAADKGVYVLAATNHPDRIDRAVLRTGRIDELIYVDMPDALARESLFRLSLSRLPASEDIDYPRLAELSKGFNCSDISYIVRMASRKKFRESIHAKEQPYKRITQDLLEEAIAEKAPSVSAHDLREFERLRREFSPQDNTTTHRSIGFC